MLLMVPFALQRLLVLFTNIYACFRCHLQKFILFIHPSVDGHLGPPTVTRVCVQVLCGRVFILR